MAECEVCGKSVPRTKRAEIDNVIFEVCDECASLGKVLPRERKVLIRKRREAMEPEEPRELVHDFAQRVRGAREKRGLRQEEASKRMGVSSSTLKRVEGGSRMDDDTMRRIQRFYGINLYEKE